jgi:hypothetical protein
MLYSGDEWLLNETRLSWGTISLLNMQITGHRNNTRMVLVHTEASMWTCSCKSVTESRGLDCVWNVMAHVQKPDFVFWRKRRVHLNRQGRQFSPLLAAEVCASAVVMLDTPCSEVVWRVLATHSILHLSVQSPASVSPCAITFQLDSTQIENLWQIAHIY